MAGNAERSTPDGEPGQREGDVLFSNGDGALVSRREPHPCLELHFLRGGPRLDVSGMIGPPPWQLEAVAVRRDIAALATASCLHAVTTDLGHWCNDVAGGIQDVAVGDGWVAALTRDQMVVLYTLGGAQYFALKTVGDGDRLAGHADRLSVFSTLTDAGERQEMTVWLQEFAVPVSCSGPRLLLSAPVPLPSGRCLAWSSYTVEGNVAIADTRGCLHLRHRGGFWLQVLERHRNPNRIVFICETQQEVWFLRSRRWPPPKIMDRVKFSLPFRNAVEDNGHAEVEEELALASLQMDSLRQLGSEVETVHQHRALLKLFAKSLRSDRASRALEVAALMEPALVRLACKYAAASGFEAIEQHLKRMFRRGGEAAVLEEQHRQEDTEPQVQEGHREPIPEPDLERAPEPDLEAHGGGEDSAPGHHGGGHRRRGRRGGRRRRRQRRIIQQLRTRDLESPY
ncbi:WD repeat and HMG-box DNA-binding protein 1-like isoform X2 [Haemaphysalis longicornis]